MNITLIILNILGALLNFNNAFFNDKLEIWQKKISFSIGFLNFIFTIYLLTKQL